MPINRRSLLGKGFLALGAGIVARGALVGPVQAAPDTEAALRNLTPILQSGAIEPERLERYMTDHFGSPEYENALGLYITSLSMEWPTVTAHDSYSRYSPVREYYAGLAPEMRVTLEGFTHDQNTLENLQGKLSDAHQSRKQVHLVFE